MAQGCPESPRNLLDRNRARSADIELPIVAGALRAARLLQRELAPMHDKRDGGHARNAGGPFAGRLPLQAHQAVGLAETMEILLDSVCRKSSTTGLGASVKCRQSLVGPLAIPIASPRSRGSGLWSPLDSLSWVEKKQLILSR